MNSVKQEYRFTEAAFLFELTEILPDCGQLFFALRNVDRPPAILRRYASGIYIPRYIIAIPVR